MSYVLFDVHLPNVIRVLCLSLHVFASCSVSHHVHSVARGRKPNPTHPPQSHPLDLHSNVMPSEMGGLVRACQYMGRAEENRKAYGANIGPCRAKR